MPSYTYPALRDALGVSHPTILRVAKDLGIKAERSGRGPGRPYSLPLRAALALAVRLRLSLSFGVERKTAEHLARLVYDGNQLRDSWLVKRPWSSGFDLWPEPPSAEDREELDIVIPLGHVVADCLDVLLEGRV